MNEIDTNIDAFINNAKVWRKELFKLRSIILNCGLAEEFKWHQPCYTFNGSNVVIMGTLKNCCVLSFFKGALLKDEQNILQKPGSNTQAARVIRFKNVNVIIELEKFIIAYINEAIEIEKAGLKVDFKEKHELVLAPELLQKFDEIAGLKAAFEKLTPGRQRTYNLNFLQPKQSKTRMSRIEKHVPRIFSGKGLND